MSLNVFCLPFTSQKGTVHIWVRFPRTEICPDLCPFYSGKIAVAKTKGNLFFQLYLRELKTQITGRNCQVTPTPLPLTKAYPCTLNYSAYCRVRGCSEV